MSYEGWKIVGVSHYYEQRIGNEASRIVALDRVTFTQPYGEIVGLIGGKGAGKSSLGHLLTQRVTPSEGFLSGGREKIGVLAVPKRRQEERTGESYSYHQLAKWGLSAKQQSSILPLIHEFSELGDLFYSRIRTYTFEEKIQLELSLLLHQAPSIIYIDEGLLQVKEHFYLKVCLFLAKLKDAGASIWLETENVARIEPYCDKLVWLEFGELQQYGEVYKVLTHYDMYYYRIKRQTVKQQQAFWEEGYRQQLRTLEEEAVTDVSSQRPDVEGNDAPLILDILDEDCIREEEEESRRDLYHQTFHLGDTWVAAAGLIFLTGVLVLIGYLSESWVAPHNVGLPDTKGSIKQELTSDQQTKELETAQVTREHDTRDINKSEDPSPSQSSESAPFSHVVVEGDTLASVAESYQVSVTGLRAVNQLEEDMIYLGETLRLPLSTPPDSTRLSSQAEKDDSNQRFKDYVVVEGDNLYSLSRYYGVSIDSLQQANHLQTEQLKPGDVLKIPVG